MEKLEFFQHFLSDTIPEDKQLDCLNICVRDYIYSPLHLHFIEKSSKENLKTFVSEKYDEPRKFNEVLEHSPEIFLSVYKILLNEGYSSQLRIQNPIKTNPLLDLMRMGIKPTKEMVDENKILMENHSAISSSDHHGRHMIGEMFKLGLSFEETKKLLTRGNNSDILPTLLPNLIDHENWKDTLFEIGYDIFCNGVYGTVVSDIFHFVDAIGLENTSHQKGWSAVQREKEWISELGNYRNYALETLDADFLQKMHRSGNLRDIIEKVTDFFESLKSLPDWDGKQQEFQIILDAKVENIIEKNITQYPVMSSLFAHVYFLKNDEFLNEVVSKSFSNLVENCDKDIDKAEQKKTFQFLASCIYQYPEALSKENFSLFNQWIEKYPSFINMCIPSTRIENLKENCEIFFNIATGFLDNKKLSRPTDSSWTGDSLWSPKNIGVQSFVEILHDSVQSNEKAKKQLYQFLFGLTLLDNFHIDLLKTIENGLSKEKSIQSFPLNEIKDMSNNDYLNSMGRRKIIQKITEDLSLSNDLNVIQSLHDDGVPNELLLNFIWNDKTIEFDESLEIPIETNDNFGTI